MLNKFNHKLIITLLLLNNSLSYAINQKFADVPLNLQNKSTISTAYKIKPNVALYIDDSTSMVLGMDDGSNISKMDSVKISLYDIVNTYRNDFFFGCFQSR